MKRRRKYLIAALSIVAAVQVVAWLHAWHLNYVPAMRAVLAPLLEETDALLRARGEALSETAVVLLICSENAADLSKRELDRLSDLVPPKWRVASELDPPSDVKLTASECVGCSRFCIGPVLSTPLLAIVDTGSWENGHSAVMHRHYVVQVGFWFWTVRTQLTSMS